MNEQINEGGPAFPGEQGHTPEGGWNQTWEPGMSLRDWFAGQALAGILSRPYRGGTPREFAEDAYEQADAMLAARNEVKP